MRRVGRCAVAAIIMIVAAAIPARADTAYAYWSYWQAGNDKWTYAKVGPAMSPAVDGAVDGWRFAVGTTTSAATPRSRPSFADVCDGTAPSKGNVRVAVFIDYGTDGPPARSACAVVAQGLTRASALAAVAPLRMDNGFICAIDRYPSTGCGDAAPTPVDSTTPEEQTSTPASTIITMLLGGVALAIALRNARRQRGDA